LTVAAPSSASNPRNDRRRGPSCRRGKRRRYIIWPIVVLALLAIHPAAAQYDPPSGYYATAEGLAGPALKAALHDIIDGHTIIAYDGGDSFQALRSLDQDPNNSSRVLTVYSGTSEPKFDSPALTWNREHCWPRGYGISSTGSGASADESDLFNLRACLERVNQARGDRIYDNARTNHPTDPAVAPTGAPQCLYDAGFGQGGLWTPRPSEKGDLARAMFYMAVRYDGSDAGTVDLELGESPNAGQGIFGNLTTLLQWHLDDPVSNEERRRNDLIHDNYQSNRNPFVDRPEFVAKVFGAPELTIVMDRSAYDEGSSATATVSIPAAMSFGLAVRIIKTGDPTGSELSVPLNVTIPAGQTSAQFTVNFPTDGIADGDRPVGLAAWAEGYLSTFFALAVLDVNGGPVATTPVIGGPGRYVQNFDTLPSSGTNPWSNNLTLAGWLAQRTGTGTNIVADAGASSAGNLYSYGSTNSAERALGSIGSANAAAGNFAHGLNLQNTSGRTVALASLVYAGEQWRNGGVTNVHSLAFSCRTGSNAVNDLTPTSNTGWNSVAELDFASPVTGGTASALNGNTAPNRVVRQGNLGITIAPGQWITLRWQDPDHSGSDHGLAIDDLSLDWRVVAEGPRPQWTNAALPSGRVGDAYAHTLTADAGPTHYEVEGLPPGLQVNPATGLISGTPSAAGSFNATAYAVNAAGAERTTLPFVIAKILPVISTPPVASTLSPGQPLSAAVLSGGLANVSGTFAFASPATIPPSGVSQQTVKFTPADAANYDVLTFTIPVTVDYGSGFEGITKSNYTTGNVAIGGINWEFAEALIASGDANDFKNGLQSVRLRGYGTSALTMLADLPGGFGNISFQHRRYGTDAQIAWVVEYSTDQGATWAQAGSFTPGTDVVTFSATVNVSAPARLRIRAAVATGTPNRRANIDDLVVTSYTAPAGMTFGQWSGGLERTPDLVRAYGVGGATNAQAAGQTPVHRYDGVILSLEALVRTNDPSLKVYAQSCGGLASGGWTTNEITAADVAGLPGDPEGTARRVFSAPIGTNKTKFLRLRVELEP
jgi:endonuclease I